MNMRLKFALKAPVRHISHLDLLRALTRALRRAEIPVAFSEGFNPHMLLSFGPPLSVGSCSQSEYVDVQLTEEMDPAELVQRLNDKLPQGLRVLAAGEQRGKTSLMASLNVADYALCFLPDVSPAEADSLAQSLLSLMDKEQLLITRQRKNKTTELDVRPGMIKLELMSEHARKELQSLIESPIELGVSCWVRVRLDSPASPRPREIVELVGAELGDFLVCRTGLFAEENGELRCPLTGVSLGVLEGVDRFDQGSDRECGSWTD